MLNTLATVASVLIIPCVLAGVILPFIIRWWLAAPCAGLALALSALSYRFQREAVRELALSSAAAYRADIVLPVRRLDANGARAWKTVERRGLEGFVAKDSTAPYLSGRTTRWVKVKQRDYRVEERGFHR
jgi:hypothetical protein